MDDKEYMIDPKMLAEALEDGILTPDEVEEYRKGSRPPSDTDQPPSEVRGYEPVPPTANMASYNLIVPVNPEKPDGKQDYNMPEYVNWLLDAGVVCIYRGDKRRQWMLFDGRIYAPITEAEVKKMITDSTDIIGMDGHIMRAAIRYDRSRMATLIEYISLKLMDVFENMETSDDIHKQDRAPYLNGANIVFMNGVLHGDLCEGGMRTFLPFTQYMPFTHCLQVEYKPVGYECPVAEKWFERMLPDPDTRNFVYQLVGYTIYHRDMRQLPALFIFFGPGGTGKSTVANMIARILGKNSYAKCGLSDLANEFTRASQLAGKLLNICEETSDQSRKELKLDIGLLKKLSDGDELPFNNKGVDAYMAANTAKLLFMTNVRPDFGSDDGIVRRLYRVPFLQKVRIPRAEHTFMQSQEALTWLAMKSLNAYGRLLASAKNNPTGTIEFQVSREMMAQRVEQILSSSQLAHLQSIVGSIDYDSVRTFLTTDPEFRSRSFLYRDYKNYCAAKGIPPSKILDIRKYLPDIDHAYDLTKVKKQLIAPGVENKSRIWQFALPDNSAVTRYTQEEYDNDSDE